MASSAVTASDWCKGIGLSILASLIGGASKLAIRKSWILEHERDHRRVVVGHDDDEDDNEDDENDNGDVQSLHAPPANIVLQGDSALCLCGDTADEEDDDEIYDRDDDDIQQQLRRRRGRRGPERNDAEEGPVAIIRNNNSNSNNNGNGDGLSRSKMALPLRIGGMFGMSVLNPVCCVLAMNYASPSILAPFSGLTLVWVLLGAHPVLSEPPSPTQILAAGFIILGEVVVAVFGDHTNAATGTAVDLVRSYLAPDFMAYLIGLSIYLALLTYWIRSKHTSPILRRFAWGSIGGSITGLQNFLKDALVVVKIVSGQDRGLQRHWFLLVVMATLAGASAFIGLLLLTACMKRYDATYSAAAFVGSFVVSASIMSAAHYHTFEALHGDIVKIICYPLGLALLLIGVLLLVQDSTAAAPFVGGNVGGDSDDDEEEDEVDDQIEGPSRERKDSDISKAFQYQHVQDDPATEDDLLVV